MPFEKGHKGYWSGKKRPGVGAKVAAKLKGRRAKKLTLYSRQKLSESRKKLKLERGYLNSQETRQKMSESLKRRWREGSIQPIKGRTPWNKGLKGFLSGERHPNWQGGITPDNIKIRTSVEYDLWRKSVYKRDEHTCQKCDDNKGHNLNSHHIVNFSQNLKLRLKLSNGITLCKSCHQEFHKIHGFKDNTPYQIQEFLNQYA